MYVCMYECMYVFHFFEPLKTCVIIKIRACQGGHLEVVKLLLNNGADGSPNTITGIAPLYAATLSGNDELVRLMVQKFPHAINIPSKMDGSTALHVAAGEGSEEIIKSILQVPRYVLAT